MEKNASLGLPNDVASWGGLTTPGIITIGSCVTLSDVSDVMAGFWSSVPYTTTGIHRTTIDQDRMILAQQLLAAILNNAAFGTTPSIAFSTVANDYCNGPASAIISDANALDSFNTSGENFNIPSTTPGFSLTTISQPQAAKSAAAPDKIDW